MEKPTNLCYHQDAFDENIRGQLSQIQGYEDMALNRRNQLALLSEELTKYWGRSNSILFIP